MNQDETPNWARIAELLDAVLDLAPDDRTRRFGELGASAAEIERVESMLAHEHTRGPELTPLIEGLAAWQDELETGGDATVAGAVLGRWRLLRPLGEGGMASVWLAERADGTVEQQVAVKCLKAGLYSPELRALFAREQQILARLQHPHIARMYDSGVADNGLPYLVMERIDGEPLTAWCNRQRLDPGERLALFDQVLDALLFAHRELIVHRDLKPANILVDRRGDLKLLDFGIARLVDDTSPDQPLTRYRALTPEYAAPEQLAGERVGLSADIYALGLLLHELLTGRRASRDPIERQLHPASSQVLRAGAGFDPQASAERRQRSPARLKRELQGDLDAIINRCLAERPDERYPGVDSLKQDLDAWRQRRPISARRVGPAHRARLFLKRHWLPSAAASSVLLALLVGAGVASWQGLQAQAARTAMAAELERSTTLNRFIFDLFEGARLGLPRDQTPSTRELLLRGAEQARDGFGNNPELQAELLTLLGSVLINVGLDADAIDVLAEAVELRAGLYATDDPRLGQSRFEYARALHPNRGPTEALAQIELAVAALRRSDQPDLLARALHELGFVLSAGLQFDASIAAHEEALAIEREQDDVEALGVGLSFMARSLQRASRLEEARLLYEQSLELLTTRLGQQHYMRALVLSDYGVTLRRLAEYELAEEAAREALTASEGVYTGPHVTLAQRWNNLGAVLFHRGKRQEAIDAFGAAMRIQETLYSDGFSAAMAGLLNNMAVISMSLGEYEQAEAYLLRAMDDLELAGGRGHLFHITYSQNLGRTWKLQGRYDEAEGMLLDALERARQSWPENDERASAMLSAVGQVRWLRDRDPAGLDQIRQAHQLMLHHHGEHSDQAARRALELGEALLLLPSPDEARLLFEQALAVSETQFPDSHHQVLAARIGLAETWLQLDQPGMARTVLAPMGALPPPELGERDPLRERLLRIHTRLLAE